jgi:hypothetical protein
VWVIAKSAVRVVRAPESATIGFPAASARPAARRNLAAFLVVSKYSPMTSVLSSSTR